MGLGQTLAFGLRPAEALEGWREEHGDAFRIDILREGRWLLLADPEAIEEAFALDPEVARGGEGNAFLRPLLGGSVITMDGAEHLRRRRIVARAFPVKPHEAMIREVARDEVARWRPGERVVVLDRMRAIALEVMLRAVLGLQDERELRGARRRASTLLSLLTSQLAMASVAVLGYRLSAYHPGLLACRAAVRGDIDRAIRRARREPPRDHAISRLVHGGELDDDAIRAEALTLLVAGMDTTALTLAWAVDDLVRDGVPLRESMQRHPVAPQAARLLTQPVRIGGVEAWAGEKVVPCIHLAHQSGAWIPFGGGTRRCLGAAFALREMEIVLEEITRAVELEPLHATPDRPRRRAHLLRPHRGVPVRVKGRLLATSQSAERQSRP
jgi:cytochrome P450